MSRRKGDWVLCREGTRPWISSGGRLLLGRPAPGPGALDRAGFTSQANCKPDSGPVAQLQGPIQHLGRPSNWSSPGLKSVVNWSDTLAD